MGKRKLKAHPRPSHRKPATQPTEKRFPKQQQKQFKHAKTTLIIPNPSKKSAILSMPNGKKIHIMCRGNPLGQLETRVMLLDEKGRFTNHTRRPTQEELKEIKKFKNALSKLGWVI